jgi:hypothetical protein
MTRAREALWHVATLLAVVLMVLLRIDPLKGWEDPR